MTPEPNRRSFLGWAVCGLGAILTVFLGIPIVSYVIDPRHRKGKRSNFKLVEDLALTDLTAGSPQQGVIRDTRHDGWVLYPNDVVGRVWVVMVGPRPTLDTPEQITAFNQDSNRKKAYLLVFTTICPHLGCSVNFAGPNFLCPCHSAAFTTNGARTGAGNPAARDMDSLDWEIDVADGNRLLVQYQNFQASAATKIPA